MQNCVGNLYWKVLKSIGNICQLPQSSLGKFCWKSQLNLKFVNKSRSWEYLLKEQLHFFSKPFS
jgi:hypothetical protein